MASSSAGPAMADDEVAAVVVDNGSVMCKGSKVAQAGALKEGETRVAEAPPSAADLAANADALENDDAKVADNFWRAEALLTEAAENIAIVQQAHKAATLLDSVLGSLH